MRIAVVTDGVRARHTERRFVNIFIGKIADCYDQSESNVKDISQIQIRKTINICWIFKIIIIIELLLKLLLLKRNDMH